MNNQINLPQSSVPDYDENDAFIRELEVKYNEDPLNPVSTPIEEKPAQTVNPLRYTKKAKSRGLDLVKVKELTKTHNRDTQEAVEMRHLVREVYGIDSPKKYIHAEMLTLGARLRYMLSELDMPQVVASLISNLSQMTINSLINDCVAFSTINSVNKLHTIATGLGFDFTWFITGVPPELQTEKLTLDNPQSADRVLRLIHAEKAAASNQPALQQSAQAKQYPQMSGGMHNQQNSQMQANSHSHITNNYYQGERDLSPQPVGGHIGALTQPSVNQTGIQPIQPAISTPNPDVVQAFDFEKVGLPMLNEVSDNVFKSLEFSDYGVISVIQRRTLDNLNFISVPDTVLEPDIKKGDVLLIDVKQNQFLIKGLYAFLRYNQLQFAIVEPLSEGKVSIINKSFSATLTYDEVGEQIKIIGRAIKLIKWDIQTL